MPLECIGGGGFDDVRPLVNASALVTEITRDPISEQSPKAVDCCCSTPFMNIAHSSFAPFHGQHAWLMDCPTCASILFSCLSRVGPGRRAFSAPYQAVHHGDA